MWYYIVIWPSATSLSTEMSVWLKSVVHVLIKSQCLTATKLSYFWQSSEA